MTTDAPGKDDVLDEVALRREYDSRLPSFNALKDEALFALDATLKKHGIKFHMIHHRVKDFDSLYDKAKRKQYQKPFEQNIDVVGLRVVALFLSDIGRIGEAIREAFHVISEDNKIEEQEVSSFGYLSVHFVATMKSEYVGPRYDRISGMPFEVQVRTIAMDAWANVSHYLAYKTDADIPKELKRDFYALSGLFYVADTHFEMFFKSREQARQELTKEFAAENADLSQPINLDSLTSYLRAKWPDRSETKETGVADLVSQLSAAGFRTIKEVDDVVDIASDAFAAYEGDYPPGQDGKKGRYADVGVVRVSFNIFRPEFQTYSSYHKKTTAQPSDRPVKDRYEPYRNLIKKRKK